jgi:hypothetical protein
MASPSAQEGGSFIRYNDPYGNPLVAINRDGTIALRGVAFLADVGSPAPIQVTGAVPVISASADFESVTTAKSLSTTAPLNVMYMVTFYTTSHGDGTGNLFLRISWTDLNGVPRTYEGPAAAVFGIDLSDPASVYASTSPVVVKGGTSITVDAFYDSGASGTYDLSIRLVVVPAAV